MAASSDPSRVYTQLCIIRTWPCARFVRNEINRSEEASLLEQASLAGRTSAPIVKSIIVIQLGGFALLVCVTIPSTENSAKQESLQADTRSATMLFSLLAGLVEGVEAKEVVGEPINASQSLQALRVWTPFLPDWAWWY